MENGKTNLRWTIFPGCYEYHLRCRYENPLFPTHRRQVNETELEEAQQKDVAENQQFKRLVYDLLPEIQTAFTGKQTVNDLLGFHRKIYDLIERSGEIGGNLAEERKILTRLFVALDEDAKNSVAENEEATELLKKLREHLHGGVQMRVNNFLAQLTRKGTPILAEDVVPRFLSEDIETIEKAIIYFKQSNMLETLKHGVKNVLDSGAPDEVLAYDSNFKKKVRLIFSN
ncbi:MAG: hypothetical protein COU08_02240 [Candidatus Harrisonbacteria bacterium CG10_big_fil_rev_8_21_14_0_10_42_17]|uniref:Uncharacterized protein n=1 Tax=Candidatus Harrisonbacteria bacterium CG10_big_fil_rev_8_21_14_0_10_42_17 TaxID=1974584 RepID=A0A2M6WI89_9BACT|nr:MAG: hypothetical protein COU08_02240 [Candidatus Harrisonbacteria bacterium CG10_big_fil_rev_8_21_14_0_10_42_17]